MKNEEIKIERTKALMDAREGMMKCLTNYGLSFEEGAVLCGIICGGAIVIDCKIRGKSVRDQRKIAVGMFERALRDTITEVQQNEWKMKELVKP